MTRDAAWEGPDVAAAPPDDDYQSWPVEDPPEDDNPFAEPPPPLEGGSLAKPSEDAPDQKPTLVDYLQSHLLTTDDLETIPEPVPLVGPEILFLDTLNWLVGKPGHGKSFIAIDFAGCVGTGVRWHGHAVRRSRVLYIAAEGVRGVRQRVRAWESHYGAKMTGVDFMPFPVQSTNGSHWDALVALAARARYGFAVVDTQARVTVGVEENSNKEMGTFVHQAERLRTAGGACILLVHHVGSGSDRGRGATTLDGALSTIMKAERDGTAVKLECQKNKDGVEWDPIEFNMIPVGQSVVLATQDMIPVALRQGPSAEALRSAKLWWDAFQDEWQSSGAIEEATNTTKSTLGRHRQELRRFGYMEAQANGRFQRYRLRHDPSLDPDDVPEDEAPPEAAEPPDEDPGPDPAVQGELPWDGDQQ